MFAVDNGTPPGTGTTTITVNIEDVNDNSPSFNQTDYTFLIPDTNPLNGESQQEIDAVNNGSDYNIGNLT